MFGGRLGSQERGKPSRQVGDAFRAGEAQVAPSRRGCTRYDASPGRPRRRGPFIANLCGKLTEIHTVPLAYGLDYPVEFQPAQQRSSRQVAMRLGSLSELLAQAFQESLAAQNPAVPGFGPCRRWR